MDKFAKFATNAYPMNTISLIKVCQKRVQSFNFLFGNIYFDDIISLNELISQLFGKKIIPGHSVHIFHSGNILMDIYCSSRIIHN